MTRKKQGKAAKALIHEITSLKSAAGPGDHETRLRLATELVNTPISEADDLIEAHDLLLFLIAHAPSQQARKAFELLFSKLIHRKRSFSASVKEELNDSGIAGTQITGVYTLVFLRWLIATYPNHVRFDSFSATEETVEEIIGSLLPLSEVVYYDTSDEPDALTWLKNQAGEKKLLHTLVQLFDQSGLPEYKAVQLFAKLNCFVTIDGRHPELNRSFCAGPERPVFFHTEPLIRRIDLPALLREPLASPTPLSEEETDLLISVKRRYLAALFRETDPGTYADRNDLHYFDMGRGLRIALYGMTPDYRLPMESYIGFMAFKNNIPYAYGGAWMLADTAKIGINVFPAFRGGESAWFFGQLMRLYYQLYHPRVFIAEPYQVGKDNPEGLQSGAFWFYYRLGFRPRNPVIAHKAAAEWKKISGQPGYRTPIRLLESFVDDDLELLLEGADSKSIRRIDVVRLGKRIELSIRNRFGGNRAEAAQWLHKQGVRQPWSGAAPYLLTIADFDKLDVRVRKQLLNLVNEKSEGKDSTFAELLRHCDSHFI